MSGLNWTLGEEEGEQFTRRLQRDDKGQGQNAPPFVVGLLEQLRYSTQPVASRVCQASTDDSSLSLHIVDRLEEAGLKPIILFADGGYPSVPSALKVEKSNVDFMAPRLWVETSLSLIKRGWSLSAPRDTNH